MTPFSQPSLVWIHPDFELGFVESHVYASGTCRRTVCQLDCTCLPAGVWRFCLPVPVSKPRSLEPTLRPCTSFPPESGTTKFGDALLHSGRSTPEITAKSVPCF